MKNIRILLADDHSLFRKGVAAALAGQPGLQVVGEASDGLEAVAMARELAPDLVLMDVSMPKMNGLKAIARIKAELPQLKVVMLTFSEEDKDLFEAIKCGAEGYLLKNIGPRELVDMVRGVFIGEAPMSRATATKILAEFARHAHAGDEPDQGTSQLTGRERDVLALLAGGTTNKEIAATLKISPSTVKSHLQNIMDKLHLKNRVQAAAFALRKGLSVDPPDRSE